MQKHIDKLFIFLTVLLVNSSFVAAPVLAQNNGGGGGLQATLPASFGGIQGVAQVGQNTGDGILVVAKNLINYALSFLAVIAFGWLLWAGYQIVMAGSDDKKYEEGTKTLKNAAIGFAFIAVSWMLIQFIFFVINTIVG